jgi:hypothetical protein
MNLKQRLTAIVDIITDEAGRNPEFRTRLERVLGKTHFDARPVTKIITGEEKRKGGRRAAAVLNPIDLARHGEADLRSRLAELDLERLLDIVAQFGMDPGKLVMKWKDRDRVIDRIVEIALTRATKGEAFRRD